MSIFDKYLVNSFLHTEDSGIPLPTPFYSEDFSVSLGDFTTSGDAVWVRVTNDGNGDLFSARSGTITDKQISTLELVKTTTQESTYLQYDYKTSTEGNYDFLLIMVDNVIQKRYSGTNAWTTDGIFLHGIGSKTIRFIYWKDNSSSSGTDQVWVDNVKLYNYSESAVVNTKMYVNGDFNVKGNVVFTGGETHLGETTLRGRLNLIAPSGARHIRFDTNSAGWNMTTWTPLGVNTGGISGSTTATSSSLNNYADGSLVWSTGSSSGLDYMQLPKTSVQVRFGEFAGSDPTKILVVNGQSIFRDTLNVASTSNPEIIVERKLNGSITTGTLIGKYSFYAQDDSAGRVREETAYIKQVGITNWNSTASESKLSFGVLNNNGVFFDDALVIRETGKIGIGTSAPETKLDINHNEILGGTAGNTVLLSKRSIAGGSGGNVVSVQEYALRVSAGTTWTTWMYHNSIDVDNVYDNPSSNTRCFWQRQPNTSKQFFGSGTNYTLTIDALNNRIGINQVSPSYSLDLTGSMRLSNAPTTSAGGFEFITRNTSTGVVEKKLGYKVYTALISQSGTAAPTVTVLENTLGGTVAWTRSSVGTYIGTLSGAFTANKTAGWIQHNLNGSYAFGTDTVWYSVDQDTGSTVKINVTNQSGTATDSSMKQASLEIRVYP
jgi:hypothetical protein